MVLSRRPLWQRLAIAPVAVLVALLMRLALIPLTGHEGPFLLFFSAVLLSAWVGGNLGGVLAAALSAPIATVFFLNPSILVQGQIVGPMILIGFFLLDALLISSITDRLQVTADHAATRQAELTSLIDGVHDYAIFLLTPDGHVASWNTGAERITGFRAEEAIGQPLALFYPGEERDAHKPETALLAAAAGHYTGEGWHQRKDGTRFWANVVITPLSDDTGRMTGFAKVVRDVTELRQRAEELEQRVVERTAELAAANDELRTTETRLLVSLHEKEVLLKEIHHRVKNNLQVVTSLLRLQARQVRDTAAVDALRESRQRVEVMAIVHELLYRADDVTSIDVKVYLRQLGTQLLRIYNEARGHVTLTVTAEDVWLSLDQAVPCGLIINELLSNSFKYAFPTGESGSIGIDLSATAPDQLTLKVWDTGVGLSTEPDATRSNSFGMTLVQDLVRQLHGTMRTENTAGVTNMITFPMHARPTSG